MNRRRGERDSMPIRVAVQRASWDVMHHKLVTPEFLRWLEKQCPGTRMAAVSDEDIMERALDFFDAVLFPGSIGSALAVEKYGGIYRAAVRDFVRRGGSFIGICGGCYAAVTDFRPRKAARAALYGAVKNPGPIRDTMSGFSSVDKRIGRKTGRAASSKMASALFRGRMRTFDLINATATTPLFFCDPGFIKDRWSCLVTEGRLLRVRIKITESVHPLTKGHEGSEVYSAYSGGAILENPGYGVESLATYEACETVPEAKGKIAVALARHGDGLVIVSGPDFYIPFETEPGVVIRGEMVPSVPWLTKNIVSGHLVCYGFGRAVS